MASSRDVLGSSEAEVTEAPGAMRNFEGIVSRLHQLVEDGTLKPGDKLPAERKIAELFGVGRSSVRDAIRILEARGIVKSRQGGGTVVQAFSSDNLVTELAGALVRRRALVQELMEVRAMLEPPPGTPPPRRSSTSRTSCAGSGAGWSAASWPWRRTPPSTRSWPGPPGTAWSSPSSTPW